MRRLMQLLLLVTLLLTLPTAALARPLPPASTAPDLSFAVISDIHVIAGDREAEQRLRTALLDIHRAAPDAALLVVNGDLGNGRPQDYEQLRAILASTPHPPVRYTIGNHEFYRAFYTPDGRYSRESFPNGETDGTAIARFLAFAGRDRVYGTETVAGYPFIYLGSECSRISRLEYADSACLSHDQLSWLKARLAEAHASGRPIFVFLHQPITQTVAGSAFPAYMRAVQQGEELRALLQQYPEVILFSGHTHWALSHPLTLVRQGFTMVNSSSVRSPSDARDRQILGMSEGLIVSVYPDRVLIRGREFGRGRWVPEATFSIPQGQR
ncbi:MAG: metallophosphoesterase family protein [Mycobacterium leprae]